MSLMFSLLWYCLCVGYCRRVTKGIRETAKARVRKREQEVKRECEEACGSRDRDRVWDGDGDGENREWKQPRGHTQ